MHDLNILTIGTDETIFEKDSALRQRVQSYGINFTSFHIFCKSDAGRITETSGRIVIHPLPKFWPFFLLAGFSAGSSLVGGGGRWMISAENTSLEGVLAFLLSRRFSVPLQLQVHTDVFSPWFRRAGWKEYIRFWLAKVFVPRADCIRVVSRRIAESLYRTKFGTRTELSSVQKVTILPIFTDISDFFNSQPALATEKRFKDYNFKMIAVGRFVDKEKNFSMLIDMMRDFTKVCPRALLVLVGDGPDRKNYESRIRGQGLEKYVILEGWRDDLQQLYKSFDLYLMSSNYEGWGRAVIEAMASCLPVVMTDVGLAGEVLKNGQNGIVVPVADKRAMLQAVKDLYQNPELRAKFAKAGQETVKNLEPRSKEDYMKAYAASYCYSKN